MRGCQQTPKMGAMMDTPGRMEVYTTFRCDVQTTPSKALYDYDPPQLQFQQEKSSNTPCS